MSGISLEIKQDSPRHKLIAKGIEARIKMSKKGMEELHTQWRNAEEQYIAYMPERDVDAAKRSKREGGQPQYTTLALPFGYALLMTAHTYYTTVFLSRNPIMQYAARHGATASNVQAVEALIDYQVHVGRQLVPYYIWLLDVGKYGIGIMWNWWEEETIVTSTIEEVEVMFAGLLPTGKTKRRKQTRRAKGYHGNKVINVRPYDWYPDTRVPFHRHQDGEFEGRKVDLGWNEILQREEAGEFFNIDKLKMEKNRRFREAHGTGQATYPQDIHLEETEELEDVDFMPFYEIVIELQPKKWKLGSGTTPEKWVFTITDDFGLIIGARPLGALHNKYPAIVQEYEPEGYTISNRGLLDVTKPLTDTMDWLFNTHFYNVRKALNDQIVVDPSRVVMKDVLDPLPGGVWRLKPAAYGTNPKDVWSQVAIADTTANHLKDAQIVSEFAMRAVGVSENLMGMLNPRGRKTATEVRTSAAGATNRLQTQSEYYSALAWEDMSQMFLQNTQQYYDMEQNFKIAGDLLMVGNDRFINITPDDIQGFYDFVPVDGTLPVDRFAQANLWRELLGMFRQIPSLAADYDVGGIFAWTAQLAGLKNINQFKISLQDPEQLENLVMKGNLVSLQEAADELGNRAIGATGTPVGGGEEELSRVSEPGQVSGMGATG